MCLLRNQSITDRGRVGREGESSSPLVPNLAEGNGKFSTRLDTLYSARDASYCRISEQPLGTWEDFKEKQVDNKY